MERDIVSVVNSVELGQQDFVVVQGNRDTRGGHKIIDIGLILLIIKICICIALVGLIVHNGFLNCREWEKRFDFENLHHLTDGVTDFEELVSRLAKFLKDERGIRVDFFAKDRMKNVLRRQSSTEEISLLQNSPEVQAFISLTPCDVADGNQFDNAHGKSSRKTLLVPLFMNKTTPCWALRGCNNNRCACFEKDDIDRCWTRSGKGLREMFSKQEGKVRCISCACFLPVGVFSVSGEGVSDVYKLIENCADTVRSAVTCHRAAHAKTRDPQTGLLNERGFLDHLDVQQRIAAQFNLPLSIGMFALDPVPKQEFGDEFLRELGKVTVGFLAKSDILARHSDDIFSIIFVGKRKDDAFLVLEKIRDKVSAEASMHGRPITISAGVAGVPEDVVKDETLPLQIKAFYALKEAQTVRNRVVSYTP